MLFQHDRAEPIGVWTEISEDARGLFVRGQLAKDVGRARDVLSLMRGGALDGLSIGFRTVRATNDAETGVRRVVEDDLGKISVVTFPMQLDARIDAVKRVSGATADRPDIRTLAYAGCGAVAWRRTRGDCQGLCQIEGRAGGRAALPGRSPEWISWLTGPAPFTGGNSERITRWSAASGRRRHLLTSFKEKNTMDQQTRPSGESKSDQKRRTRRCLRRLRRRLRGLQGCQ